MNNTIDNTEQLTEEKPSTAKKVITVTGKFLGGYIVKFFRSRVISLLKAIINFSLITVLGTIKNYINLLKNKKLSLPTVLLTLFIMGAAYLHSITLNKTLNLFIEDESLSLLVSGITAMSLEVMVLYSLFNWSKFYVTLTMELLVLFVLASIGIYELNELKVNVASLTWKETLRNSKFISVYIRIVVGLLLFIGVLGLGRLVRRKIYQEYRNTIERFKHVESTIASALGFGKVLKNKYQEFEQKLKSHKKTVDEFFQTRPETLPIAGSKEEKKLIKEKNKVSLEDFDRTHNSLKLNFANFASAYNLKTADLQKYLERNGMNDYKYFVMLPEKKKRTKKPKKTE